MSEEGTTPAKSRFSICRWLTRRRSEPKPIEEQLLDDIGRMVEHCRSKGIAILDDETIALIGRLQPAPGTNGTPPTIQDLLELQGKLSELIKPATPQSLEATEIRWNSKTALTWVLLVVLTVAAIGGIVGYVGLVSYVQADASVANATSSPPCRKQRVRWPRLTAYGCAWRSPR
jgi:hypothetical protein